MKKVKLSNKVYKNGFIGKPVPLTPTLIGISLLNQHYSRVRTLARVDKDVNDLVRKSVHKELASVSYLSIEQKKALGVTG